MFIETKTTTQTTHAVNNTKTNLNGGYIAYWKLYGQLLKQIKAFPYPSASAKRKMWMGFILKTLWWIAIKPLGQFFSTKKFITGRYMDINGKMKNIDLVCKTQYRIFSIPVFSTVSTNFEKNLQLL